MTSISLLSTEASALAFTPLYLQFHVPALRISTKLTFKLKPGGSKHIFKAIEDVVLSFTDNLRDDLASVEQNQILQEFSSMSERAVQSLEEWQEFVDEWKATLIGRLSELHKQVVTSNEKVLAAQASEKEASEMLRVKDVEINALLMKEQMMQAPVPPSLPQGSRRPSNATNASSHWQSLKTQFARRPSNVSIPSPAISEANESSPKIKRRLSFQNVVSAVVGSSVRRKSDSCVQITAVPVCELHPDLINAQKLRARASIQICQKENSTAEMSSAASSASSVGSRPITLTARQEESTTEASGRPTDSSKSDDDATSVSSLSQDSQTGSPRASSEGRSPARSKRSIEPEVVHVRRPTAEKASQCFAPICHRAVQCTLFTEIPQTAPIGFGFATSDQTYIKHRGAGSIVSTPRLPAIRRFAFTQG